MVSQERLVGLRFVLLEAPAAWAAALQASYSWSLAPGISP